jgi:glycosyltransferase involved in cell wall biosynthesis
MSDSPPGRSGAPATRPPELLVVAEDGQPGGIGRYCVDVAAVIGEGSAVACLCPIDCDGRSCWLAQRCAARDVELIRVPMPRRGWRTGLRGLVGVWRRRGKPVIHANGRRGNFVSVLARLTVPGYRFITTAHGMLGLHDRRNVVYRVVDIGATRAAWAVIAVSADTRRRLVAAGSPARRTHLVLNGLTDADLARFGETAAGRAGATRHGTRIGFLGRLSREKGTAELVRLGASLSVEDPVADGPGHGPTHLVIAGDGPERDRVATELADGIDAGRVTLTGAIDDVAGFLGGIDILVMPSHNEGLPYVLLEAMAAGCAVVAFRVGGIPEVIDAPETGVLVPPGDVDGLIAAVRALIADPARAAAIGAAARSRIVAAFALPDRLPLLAAAARGEPASGDPPAAGTGARA